MSLKGRLGGTVMKRIEALPSVQAETQRAERTGPSEAAARKLAYTRLNDEAAKAKLCELLDATPEVLKETAIVMSKRREDYINDRAYRLLSAAAADRAVLPIPPERAELFGREGALGHMPIEEAFALLIESEPRLADMRAMRAHSLPGAGRRLPVGGGHPPATAHAGRRRCGGAGRVAVHGARHQHRAPVPADARRRGRSASTQTPYWEIPRRKVVLTGTFGPRQHKPAAGRA